MFEAIHSRAGGRALGLAPSLLLLLVLACAKTTLTSVVNPPFRTTELRRVVVFFESDDPLIRRSFEDNFGTRAEIESVEFIPSYTLSSEPPFAGDVFALIARENRIDALLTFTYEDELVREPSTALREFGRCHPDRPLAPCPPPRDGGWLEMLWASYTVALVDPVDGTAFWTANALSEERDLATWEDLRNSLTDETVERLVKDGVF